MSVKFKTTDTDLALIECIVDRGMTLEWSRNSYESRRDMQMDVTAVHLNGNPLRLADLAKSDDFNFAHDMSGICNCLDRSTGKLTKNFSPRFSRRSTRPA